MITAIVLGASGYTGMLLLRILAHHPQIRSIIASSRSGAGTHVLETDPGLSTATLRTGKIHPVVLSPGDALARDADVVFSALPHLASAAVCEPILGKIPLIDLSADFRFRDPRLFTLAYGEAPPSPDFQGEAVYGLVERARPAVREAMIIANPGCYPTATLLPLLPIVEAGLVVPGSIVINAMSGISGAGRKEKRNLLFGERSETVSAYNPGTLHRHSREIMEQIGLARVGTEEGLLFTPHLVPIKQGMAVTTVIETTDPDTAQTALIDAYAKEPFVRLLGTTAPETAHCRGTNEIRIGVRKEGQRLILMSAIDNLWKGASGQAVQNMNVRFGFAEDAGLVREAEL